MLSMLNPDLCQLAYSRETKRLRTARNDQMPTVSGESQQLIVHSLQSM
jgi:hypothetical protein